MKRRTILLIQQIQGQDNKDEINKIDDDFFKTYKPSKFDGSDGVELRFIDDFEESYVLINQNINKEAKSMTTYEYFKTIQVLKKQAKERKKALKRR